MVEGKQPDWLAELFPNAKAQQKEIREKGLLFAQKYLVFSGPTADPRARELLEHWTQKIRKTQLPKNASAQELAAHNAMREFVEAVHSQIEFAAGNASSLDWLNT